MKKIRCVSLLLVFITFTNIETPKKENEIINNFSERENCGLMNYEKAIEYSKQKYSNSKYSSVKAIEKMIDPDRFPENYKFVQSHGFRQTSFNNNYNDLYKDTPFSYGGTCTETAATMVFWNEYRRIIGSNPGETAQFYFNSSLNYAIANKYFPANVENEYDLKGILVSSYNTGTKDDAIVMIEKYLMNGYLEEYDFWQNRDNIYQGVKDFTGAGKVQAFRVPGHLMMAIGYMRVPIQYYTTEGWWFAKHLVYHLDYVDFLICCNGWESKNYNSKDVIDDMVLGAYFPIDYIDSKEYYAVGMSNIREDSGR